MTPATSRLSVAVLIVITAVLTGCASTGSGQPAAPQQPSAPADLTGEWKQSNSKSKDSYQEATITGDTITINWVSDDGDTTALYWAGSYTPPTAAGAFTWTSNNDTSQTENALLASSDPTKDFTYDGTEISYKVTALGTTTTVKLAKQ